MEKTLKYGSLFRRKCLEVREREVEKTDVNPNIGRVKICEIETENI